MSGKDEKTYMKIKNKLESLGTKVISLEKEISKLRKDFKNKKMQDEVLKNKNSLENVKSKKINFVILIPIIPIIVLFLILLFFYNYKHKNAIIVLEGMPQNFRCDNFKGNLEMYPQYIDIDSGKIVNRNYMKVIIDMQEFDVKPGDFIIEFDCYKDIDIYGIPYGNVFRTRNSDIRISSNTNSNYNVTASQLLFTRGNNVTEYQLNSFISKNNQSEYIYAENFDTNGLLEIQDKDTIICTGGMYIYINGEDIVKKNQSYKEIQLCSLQKGFSLSFFIQFQKCTFSFSKINGISMNGTINGFSGKTGIKGSKMIYTSLNEQKSYDIGGLDIAGEGEELNITYDFDSTVNEINITGKIKELVLFGVNINESIITFIYSNITSIVSAIITSLLTSIIVAVLKKRKVE